MASKLEIDVQLAALAAVIGNAQAGLGIHEISAQANLGLDRRTLQRRLETLVEAGQVVRAGNGSSTRYQRRIAGGATSGAGAPPVVHPVIPLSTQGVKVQAAIRQPLPARGIVGYERGFLDAYRPNVTNYLSKSEQAHLRTIGQPNVAAQPAGTYAKNVLNRLLIDAGDQAPFREMAEAELMALHEGNFARYQIRPTEFMAWHKHWRGAP